MVKLKVSDCSDGELVVRVGKSAAATRKVPIHSQLVEITNSRINGKAQDDYLLPELHGNANPLVKRFAAYRQRLYGKNEGQAQKTYHSLRHHWVDERLKAGCEPYLVQFLAGHKLKGVTFENYYHGPAANQRKAIVEAVSLPWRAGDL